MKRVALATAILGAGALTLQAQSPSAPSSTKTIVSGYVVVDSTGEPVRNVRIAIANGELGSTTLTDDQGRFTLDITSVTSSIRAFKTGYAPASAKVAAGQPIEIRLRRGGVLSGRIIDALGEPVPGVRMTADLAPGFDSTDMPGAMSTTTDDRGEYRIGRLREGTYVVSAGPQGVALLSRPTQVPKIYFPSVASFAEASPVQLKEGDEVAGLDLEIPVEELALPLLTVVRRQDNPDARVDGTGIIRGHVFTTKGAAVPHAVVTLMAAGDVAQTRVARADTQGAFEFSRVPAGAFRIVPRKRGYYMMNRPDTTRTVELTENEIKDRADVVLEFGAAIAGRVVDELGDPIQNANVEALHVRYEAGRRRLVQAGGTVVTNDLGEYRLWNRPPGNYIVSAGGGGPALAALPAYSRSFYPGTPTPGLALFVALDGERDAIGIDFALARTTTFRITGDIVDPSGQPTMGGAFSLIPSAGSGSVVGVPLGARIEQDGTFEFSGVSPGQYIIRAETGRGHPSTEGGFAALTVTVIDRDVENVHVRMASGSQIVGRVQFDAFDRASHPSFADLEIITVPVDYDLTPSRLATSKVAGDGVFQLSNIHSPRRLQVIGLPEGWGLKEVRVNNLDMTDQLLPFGRSDQSLNNVDIILTDRINRVAGTVGGTNGRSMAGATIILFSTDRDRWYPGSRFVQATLANSSQAYSLTGLPPGSYYGAVVGRAPDDGDDAWRDPAYLESLIVGATSFTLGNGETIAVNLRSR